MADITKRQESILSCGHCTEYEQVSRRDFLVGYQDAVLAERYVDLVERVRRTEEAITDGNQLADTVARAYFKTLAYKDEYEVARLYTQTDFLGTLRKDFGDRASVRFHLAPPLLAGGTDARGRPRKREFGRWVLPLFRLLARMKGLRCPSQSAAMPTGRRMRACHNPYWARTTPTTARLPLLPSMYVGNVGR